MAQTALAQSWSGILASSRAINWSNAGLPANLPDGETTSNSWTPPARTQCGPTVNPSGLTNGTDVTNINAALAACSAGHYVLLGPGTFYIENSAHCYGGTSETCIEMYAQNGVTLRGSGAQATILQFTGDSAIELGEIGVIGYGTGTWTGASQSATSITVTVASGNAPAAGRIMELQECDTGFSGSGCSTGSSADNGGLFVCGDNITCAHAGTSSGPHQEQNVYITSVSGSGPYTVNFSPGLYLPNWSSSNSPTANWNGDSYGNGLEDLTFYTVSNTVNSTVDVNNSYASWVKGVRFVGSATYEPLIIIGSKNILLMNSYFFSDVLIDANYPPPFQEANSSDDLIINNITASGVPYDGTGGNEGDVKAFNYGRDAIAGTGGEYADYFFEHNAGSAFHLYEGNQVGIRQDDVVHGTHDFNTDFRNYYSGWDPPFIFQYGEPRGILWAAYARFDNAIGNSIGSALITTYQCSQPAGSTSCAFPLNTDTSQNDPLVVATALRWGNWDSATNAVRWCGNSGSPGWSTTCASTSEIPTILSGNAAPFENPVPSNTNLPCSFFLSNYTSSGACTPKYSGGTGLPFWKVCTVWTTFPTSCSTTQTPAFPIAGPDITGGPYNSGTAYDNPAALAFKNLPVDPVFQQSYTVTGSSWSSGTETLTVNGLPAGSNHLMGPFQISGGACSTGSGEAYITASSQTTISYALASNPGSCTGTMKFPDVRQFDERVYQADNSSASVVYGEVLAGDTSVTLNDAVAAAQYAIGLPVTINLQAGEVDGTSTVTLNDAVLIAQYVVGLISKFPVQN